MCAVSELSLQHCQQTKIIGYANSEYLMAGCVTYLISIKASFLGSRKVNYLIFLHETPSAMSLTNQQACPSRSAIWCVLQTNQQDCTRVRHQQTA